MLHTWTMSIPDRSLLKSSSSNNPRSPFSPYLKDLNAFQGDYESAHRIQLVRNNHQGRCWDARHPPNTERLP